MRESIDQICERHEKEIEEYGAQIGWVVNGCKITIVRGKMIIADRDFSKRGAIELRNWIDEHVDELMRSDDER